MATSAMSNDESYYGISYLTTSTITKMIIFLFSFYSKLEISREFFLSLANYANYALVGVFNGVELDNENEETGNFID